MNEKRNYGIDLLRLVLMFMVCIEHALVITGVLYDGEVGTLAYKTFWLLEAFSYCAVDSFAIISGYMAKDKPQKYEKLVSMWFQVFFYSFILTLILTIVGVNESWHTSDIIKSALPVIFVKYWYFTAYFVLFLAMPILNKFLFAIKEDTAKKTFIVIIVLFSIIGFVRDSFSSNFGYSPIWLIVLYCIGVLAKRIKLFETKKTITLIILWILCILSSWLVKSFVGITRFINYISPTILLSGIIMVVLFSRIQLKGTIISKLSPLAFGIYLCQLNPVVWDNILRRVAPNILNSEDVAISVLYLFAFALFIFVLGLAVEFIRSRLAKILKINVLSEKIVKLTDKILTRLFVFLK